MNQALIEEIGKGILETIYMTSVATFFAYMVGIPLGIILNITDKDGLYPIKVINKILGFIVNIVRSIPFLILLVLIFPFTRFIVGTTIGSTATIVPLVVASAPFVARMVESSLKEVNGGVIEAAQAMGASNMRIIFKVLLPEAKPSLLVGAAISITTILGYSALAGFVAGGGLGTIAINYGYYRYNKEVMIVTVFLLIVIVQLFQEIGMRISLKTDRRIKN